LRDDKPTAAQVAERLNEDEGISEYIVVHIDASSI
jgi:hypothetical protein